FHEGGATPREMGPGGPAGGDGFPEVATLVGAHNGRAAGPERLVPAHGGDLRHSAGLRQISRAKHADDPRRRESRRSINPDARVRVDATNDRDVKHAHHSEIVDERGFTAEEPSVFEPLPGSADVGSTHMRCLRQTPEYENSRIAGRDFLTSDSTQGAGIPFANNPDPW